LHGFRFFKTHSRAEAQQIVENYAQAYQQSAAKVEQLKHQAEQQARLASAQLAMRWRLLRKGLPPLHNTPFKLRRMHIWRGEHSPDV